MERKKEMTKKDYGHCWLWKRILLAIPCFFGAGTCALLLRVFYLDLSSGRVKWEIVYGGVIGAAVLFFFFLGGFLALYISLLKGLFCLYWPWRKELATMKKGSWSLKSESKLGQVPVGYLADICFIVFISRPWSQFCLWWFHQWGHISWLRRSPWRSRDQHPFQSWRGIGPSFWPRSHLTSDDFLKYA